MPPMQRFHRIAAVVTFPTYLAHLTFLLCHHYSTCGTTTRDDTNVMYAQRLNPTTGLLEWAVVDLTGDCTHMCVQHA